MDQSIEEFFQQFERANESSDLATIGGLYADTFMFGGVNGVQVVRKEDFLKVVPKMKTHLASMGLSGTQLKDVEGSVMDTKYVLAKATWRMTLRELNGHSKDIDTFATYVLARKGNNTLSIILQIDHQDLATIIKNQQTVS